MDSCLNLKKIQIDELMKQNSLLFMKTVYSKFQPSTNTHARKIIRIFCDILMFCYYLKSVLLQYFSNHLLKCNSLITFLSDR